MFHLFEMGNLMFGFQRFIVNDEEEAAAINAEREANGGNRNRFRIVARRDRGEVRNNREEARRIRRLRREFRRGDADELIMRMRDRDIDWANEPVHEGMPIPMFIQRRRREIVEQLAEIHHIDFDAMEELLQNGPPFDFMEFLNARERMIRDQIRGDRALRVPPEREYIRPFPLKTTCEFHIHNLTTCEGQHEWNGLTWAFTCENYVTVTKLVVARLSLVFSGMGDKCFRVWTSCNFKRTIMNFKYKDKNILLVDKNHRTFIFPDIKISGPYRIDNEMLDPKIKFCFSVDQIEFAPEFRYQDQQWPMANRWVSFEDVYSVKVRRETLKVHHPKIDRLLEDMRLGTLSRKEADAIILFAGFLCNKWYVSTKIFHELLVNAYKLGFTENWNRLDTPDSGYDFNTKTLLPFYHDFVSDAPREQMGFRTKTPSGVCQIFKMKLNPDESHKRNQIETMRFAKGHRGQFTFYLEESPHGLLLMMGGVFKVVGRQNAKLKLTYFEHGVTCALYKTYRILYDKQRTCGFVVALLTEEKIELLKGGYLSVGIQLHFHDSDATFVRTYLDDADYSSPYIMPGPCNAWLVCGDGKKIGVCKEFVTNHCEQLSVMFYNTSFVDCGSDTATVKEPSSIVLLALEILYHRSLALNFETFRGILGLASYWLSSMIKRYVEMAILHTDQIEPSDKLELARFYDLDMIKYIVRHPEYASGYDIKVSDAERATVATPSANELDGGPMGRGPVERRA